MRKFLSVVAAGSLLAGCADAGNNDPANNFTDGININVAALNLQGVADVVWDLEVLNGDGETVWQQRISSTQYGDSAGSASYVGPCDAAANVVEAGVCGTSGTCTNKHRVAPYQTTPTTCTNATGSPIADASCDFTINYNKNDVNVYVVGVYDAAVTTPGAFGAIQPQIADLVDFQNPTWDDVNNDNTRNTGDTITPLNRNFTCLENQDVFVQFDVALMRPAQQGFFDIAVNFNSIFCSAKFDCAYEAAAPAGSCTGATGTPPTGGTCGGTSVVNNPLLTCGTDADCVVKSDIKLLHDNNGDRGKTFILGFACTAGADTSTTTGNKFTELALDDLKLTCNGGNDVFYVNTATTTDGNLCSANFTTCNNIIGKDANGNSTGASAVANTYLYQAAVYSGAEQLTSGTSLSYNKIYWNVALGIKNASDCVLTANGTADDANNSNDMVDSGQIANGTVYPYIAWNVDFTKCGAEPLIFGNSNAMVQTKYTGTALLDRDGDGTKETTNLNGGSGTGEDDFYFNHVSTATDQTFP